MGVLSLQSSNIYSNLPYTKVSSPLQAQAGVHEFLYITYKLLFSISTFFQNNCCIIQQNILNWFTQGNAFCKLGQFESAIQCYNQAIQIEPLYSLAHFNKGFAQHQLGIYDDAIECYQKAIEIDPKCDLAVFHQGEALFEQEKYQQALIYYTRALELDNLKYQSIPSNYGLTMMELGQYIEAERYFDRFVQINNKDGLSYTNKGYCLFIQGKYEEAYKCCSSAIETDKECGLAHQYQGYVLIKHLVGQILLSKNQIQLSVHCFDQCLKQDPNIGSASYYKSDYQIYVGFALHQLNKYTESCKCYKKALELDPQIEFGLIKKASIQIDNGYYAAGLSTLLQILTMNPTNQKAQSQQQQCIVLVEKRLKELTQENQDLKSKFKQDQKEINNLSSKEIHARQKLMDLEIQQEKFQVNKYLKQTESLQTQLIQAQRELKDKQLKYSTYQSKMNQILSNNAKNRKYVKREKKQELIMKLELNGYKQMFEADKREQQLREEIIQHNRIKFIPQNKEGDILILQIALNQFNPNELYYFKTFYWTMINIISTFIDYSNPSIFLDHQYHLGILNLIELKGGQTLTVLEIINQQPYFYNLFPSQFVTTLVTPQCGIAEQMHLIHLEFSRSYRQVDHKMKAMVLHKIIGYPMQEHVLHLAQVIMDVALITVKLTRDRSQNFQERNLYFPNQVKEKISTFYIYIMNQLFREFQILKQASPVIMAIEDIVHVFGFLFCNNRMNYHPNAFFQDIILELLIDGRAKSYFNSLLDD